MTGVGESLQPLGLPAMPAVLVNPRIAVATKDVFAALGLRKGELHAGVSDVIEAIAWPKAGAPIEDWLALLADGVNDLEAPAIRIQPVIGEVLARLRATGARLARMSGSGATCFAIFSNEADALRAAQTIERDHPQWWVHAGLLKSLSGRVREARPGIRRQEKIREYWIPDRRLAASGMTIGELPIFFSV